MALGYNKRAFGIFSTRWEAEMGLQELRTTGFPMDRVSIIAPDTAKRGEIAGVDVQDGVGEPKEGAAGGAAVGGVAGGFIGLIGALSAVTVAGVGPVLIGGALASILADTVIGGAVGAAAGGLAGALIGLGVPDAQARLYSDRLEKGEYLVIVEGIDDEIERADSILSRHRIREWDVYDIPSPNVAPPGYTTPIGAVAAGYTPMVTPTTGALGVPLATPLPGVTSMGTAGLGYPGDTSAVPLTQDKRAVGIFPSYRETENALNELRAAGFPMNKVSVMVQDAERQDNIAGVRVRDRVGDKAEEGAVTGVVAGGALGGLTGLLAGLGALAIPGIGPIVFAGAEAAAIASMLAGGAIGAAAGGLFGALVGLGIPEDRAKLYSDRVSAGDYLVLVTGTETEIQLAESILSDRGIQEWGTY